jgi:hypothetical protein
MKKIFSREIPVFLLISFCTIFYFSCDDSGIAPEVPTYCISGTITNWALGNKTLQAFIQNPSFTGYAIASAPIDSQGNFNICVPVTLPDSSLLVAESIFTAGCTGGTITFNPADVKGNIILSFIVTDGSNTVGELRNNNYTTLDTGSFSIVYVNTNKTAAVTGQKICISDTLNFNATAVTGWTKIIKHCTKISGPSVTYQFNITDPGGATWKFY